MDSSPLTVAVDAAALRDGRAAAGIGRYVSGLLEALPQVDDISPVACTPRRPPRPDAWGIRFLNAQPAQLRARFRRTGPRPTVFHATSGDPSLAWPLATQVVTVHDVRAWTHPAPAGGIKGRLTAMYFSFQRKRFARCGAVIAVSQATADEAREVFGLDAARMHVIGEGVSAVFTAHHGAENRDALLRRAVGVEDTGYVAWVGSLRAHDPRKAVDHLIAAVAGMEPRPSLVLVGQRGAEAARIDDLARERGLAITMTGFVDDGTLAAIYRGAGAVAISSRHEGFGLPMLEAMACGAPVVATAVANLVHLGRDEAALLVPAGDPRLLGDGLSRVLTNDALSARLRHAGPGRAAEHGWLEMVRRTAEVYREVAAGSPAIRGHADAGRVRGVRNMSR